MKHDPNAPRGASNKPNGGVYSNIKSGEKTQWMIIRP